MMKQTKIWHAMICGVAVSTLTTGCFEGNGRIEFPSFEELEVGGVEVKVYRPSDAAKPLHLGLYFHGDGANEYHDEDLYLTSLASWAETNGVLLAAPLAPNGCSWWRAPGDFRCESRSETEDHDANAEALAAVIDALRERYDLTPEKILYTGSSGGSVFLTAIFLPYYGGDFPGVYAANCGGGWPWGRVRWDVDNADLREQNPITFTIGEDDFMAETIHTAVEIYRDTGLPVKEEVIAGVGHCASGYNWPQRSIDVWAAFLQP